MRLARIIVTLVVLGTAVPAFAQQVVGTSLIDGRPVQLMSDFTWKYLTPAPAGCDAVQGTVAFCSVNSGWTRISSASPDIAAEYRLDDKNYGEFIVESLGIDDGITPDKYRDLVIQNAASAAKVQPKDIVTFGLDSAEIDGVAGTTIAYEMKMDDLPIVFINTMIMEKHRTTQVVTFHIGGNVTDSMRSVHKAFLAATHLK